MRRRLAVALAAAAVASLAVAPAAADDDDGFLGKARLRLAVDDCPAPPALDEAAMAARFTEHYNRGAVVYLQGDYQGAIGEFVAAYCLIPKASLLRDIAQAYERSVRYELAVAYLERFVRGTEDATERRNAASRVQVLSGLRSTIRVATEPANAVVTVRNLQGVRGSAVANTDDVIELPAGDYTMTIELPNYQPVETALTLGIGQPYSYSYRLVPRTGRLRVQTVPGDARIVVDDRIAGVGAFDGEVALGRHRVEVDRAGWIPGTRSVEVTDHASTDVSVELDRPPASGRWLAVTSAAALTGYLAGTVTVFSQDAGTTGGTSVAGVAVGGVLGYLLIPPDIRQSTASLLATTAVAGLLDGLQLGALLERTDNVTNTMAAGGAVLGAAAGALVVRKYDLTDGEAALVNSGLLWGSTSGVLFTQVFGGGDRTALAITAAGVNVGLVAGAVLAKRYPVSRRRAVYIDLAGAAGLIAGLAIQNAAQASGTGNNNESRAHFTLGGMAVGLGLGVFLTRNQDATVLRVKAPTASPTVTPVWDGGGGRGLVVGIGGAL
ncbi:MAG: PEGA domain-containing protein [Kofleriaceae bacterium]